LSNPINTDIFPMLIKSLACALILEWSASSMGWLKLNAATVDTVLKPELAALAPARGRLVIGQAGYKYLCFLPHGQEPQAEKRPLILFLHGDCPNEDLEKFKHFGPIGHALRQDAFPFIAVSPASNRGWSVATLNLLLHQLQRQFPVDPDRIYLTGYSSGGHATWAMALAYPARFAAIAPVAGAGNPREARQRLGHLPAWIFHGVKDQVVPVGHGRQMAEAMRWAGAEVKTTFYEDRGQDTWQMPYADPELYEWFLRQRRIVIPRPASTPVPPR
jgi:predicted peptidase